jgi:putative copper export protein
MIGSTLINFIPKNKKPTIVISSNIVFFAAFGIPVFSFISLLYNTIIIAKHIETGVWEIIPAVLRDLEFGQAWFLMLIMSCIMLILMSSRSPQQDKRINGLVGLILLGIVAAHGWASHPAGLSETWGFLSQTFHVLAVAIWVGILVIVGWFAKDEVNWASFLRWFTPLSIGCIAVLTAGGIMMMTYIVPDLLNSWAVTYGQALLIKHLLFIPILIFGFGNGFLLKIAVAGKAGIVRTWLRIESIFILLVFMVTGFLNLQQPPHPPEEGSNSIPSSPLFTWFHGATSYPQIVNWNWSIEGCISAVIAISLVWLVIRLIRRGKYLISFSAGLGFVVFGYLFIMFSVAPLNG